MSEVLIIFDNLEIAYNVDARFSNAGWSNENISVLAMMGRNSALNKSIPVRSIDYRC